MARGFDHGRWQLRVRDNFVRELEIQKRAVSRAEKLQADDPDPASPPELDPILQSTLANAERVMDDYWISKLAVQKIEANFVTSSPIGRKTARLAKLFPSRRDAMVQKFSPLIYQILRDLECDCLSSQALAWGAWLERRMSRRFRKVQEGEVIQICLGEIIEKLKREGKI